VRLSRGFAFGILLSLAMMITCRGVSVSARRSRDVEGASCSVGLLARGHARRDAAGAQHRQAYQLLHVVVYHAAMSVLACLVVLRVQAAACRLCECVCCWTVPMAPRCCRCPRSPRGRIMLFKDLQCVRACFRGARCRGTCAVGCVRLASDCVVCD
jgi:hypothetical protein